MACNSQFGGLKGHTPKANQIKNSGSHQKWVAGSDKPIAAAGSVATPTGQIGKPTPMVGRKGFMGNV
jgi:hypothetical protein